MIKKQHKRGNGVLSILLLMACLTLTGCGGEDLSPEAQIRKTIDEMEIAAEERSLSSFMEHVSKQYSDHDGNDHKAIARYVQINFIRNQSINIFSSIQSINVEGSTASVEVSTAMGSRDVDLSNEGNRLKADSMHFSVLFQLDDDKWLVKSVSWRRGW
jgi:hypothetical protein